MIVIIVVIIIIKIIIFKLIRPLSFFPAKGLKIYCRPIKHTGIFLPKVRKVDPEEFSEIVSFRQAGVSGPASLSMHPRDLHPGTLGWGWGLGTAPEYASYLELKSYEPRSDGGPSQWGL